MDICIKCGEDKPLIEILRDDLVSYGISYGSKMCYECYASTSLDKDKVPTSVSRRQLRLALVLRGVSLKSIENFIDQLPIEVKPYAEIGWNDAQEFLREDELFILMAKSIGWSDEELDELFINASKL
jgi:hypothetical protein